MSTKPQIELFLENESGTQQVAYPFVESDHVSLTNGMNIDTMIRQDVSMPTVAHEDLSFKVGVGDQDVSSAIVDSSVAEMTIKGKTYQNILPEPSTHVLSNNKEMFKVNEGLDPNVEIVDGVSKSAILKGSTKYRDIDTGEVLDAFEDGRNLELVSVRMPVLTTTGKNLFDGKLELGELSYQNGTIDNVLNYDRRHRSVNYISVKSNTNYIYSCNVGDSGCNWMWYDKDKKYIKTSGYHITATSPSNAKYLKYFSGMPQGTNLSTLKVQIEESSTTTPFEPHKSNILTVNEPIELRGIGNVQDELNCLTGEVVTRVKELNLKELNSWEMYGNSEINGTVAFNALTQNILETYTSHPNTLLCNCLPVAVYDAVVSNNFECIGLGGNYLKIRIATSKLSEISVNGLKNYLQQNDIIVVGYSATKPIKTVDLSSSGNWEKVVLDGSEGWQCDANSETGAQVYIPRHQGQKFFNSLKSQDGGGLFHDLKNTNYFKVFSIGNNYGMTVVIDKTNFPINIGTNITLGEVRELWKQWLSQNPITVWYQTETHQDSTQVKQPIFFKDGHIIQSSGANNSLIPTLDYQAKTSNSYVMDLMKTNTKYTMKAKSASGTFTIDGTSYGAGTNGTFTTPSSMTNKLLVMGNKTNEEVMILEGDLTSKDIPYFKGIKSAFEDESKIEVLSIGKNVFDYSEHPITLENLAYNNGVLAVWIGYIGVKTYVPVKENTTYTYSNDINIGIYYGLVFYDKNKNVISYVNSGENDTWIPSTFTTPKNCAYIRFSMQTQTIPTWIQIEESSIQTTHEPYKSNSTKIPLLSQFNLLIKENLEDGALNATGTNIEHADRCRTKDYIKVQPNNKYYFKHDIHQWFTVHGYNENKIWVSQLKDVKGSEGVIDIPSNVEYIKIKMDYSLQKAKETNQIFVLYKYRGLAESLKSLPNGVHDEIVLDRENNKAKIIQRVGKVVLDGSEDWGYTPDWVKGETIGFYLLNDKSNGFCLSDKFTFYHGINSVDHECVSFPKNAWLGVRIKVDKLGTQDVDGFKQYLKQNPLTVYYELATPVITEVDLEGFPYIYKDGHIFLNSEIAPVTEIKYSINQQHQIEASNQDIMRHQKEIDYLYKLIGEYVRVDYKNTLLSLNLELK